MYKAIFKKIQDAQPVGVYKETQIDSVKSNTRFHLINVSPYIIRDTQTAENIPFKTEKLFKKWAENNTYTTNF
jgi:hypothetical protein